MRASSRRSSESRETDASIEARRFSKASKELDACIWSSESTVKRSKWCSIRLSADSNRCSRALFGASRPVPSHVAQGRPLDSLRPARYRLGTRALTVPLQMEQGGLAAGRSCRRACCNSVRVRGPRRRHTRSPSDAPGGVMRDRGVRVGWQTMSKPPRNPATFVVRN